jgi:hypothetical protein
MVGRWRRSLPEDLADYLPKTLNTYVRYESS